LDKRDNATLGDDRYSRLLRWLTGMNMTHAIVLVTLVTVLGSEATTAALMLLFSAPQRWVAIGLAISTVVPLLVATVVIAFFLQMIRRLQRAHELIAELAITDMLTGIYNRRFFMSEAQKEFGKAERHRLPLSIILFDVDRFKSLNDTYGHSAGDDVLRGLSSACKKCLRASDVFARYGGEEFVILLPLTDCAAACKTAERVRRGVEEMSTYCGDVRLPVTISLGVAELIPKMTSLDEMLNKADVRLYAAKKNGRNRVECGKSLAILEAGPPILPAQETR
jgi:diguanylate cyclase (GGDEF)-like protein